MTKSPRRLLLCVASQPHQNYYRAINVGSALLLVLAFVLISCNYLLCRRRRRRTSSVPASLPDPKSELDAIPIVVYCGPHHAQPPDSGSIVEFEMENCAICLAEFEIGENVRVLPRCMHVFHVDCIDRWLVVRSLLCPVCRDRTIQAPPQPKKTSCNGSAIEPTSLVLVEFERTRNFAGNFHSYF